MNLLKKYGYHIIAIITVIIWGTTFVSTKVLINNGLSPAEILLYRFTLAYIGIWFVSPRVFFAKTLKDEFLCVAAGMCGGSLYFVFENTALEITLASNVSLIICIAPLFTAFLARLTNKNDRIRSRLMVGSAMALLGVFFVVYNGSFILKISPLGDILTIMAALSWACYSLVLRRLQGVYSTLFITRKVFFYGIATLLPYLLIRGEELHLSFLSAPVIAFNLLFLGLIASLLCFISWNMAVKVLGVVRISNYIYFTPVITLIASALIIDEVITGVALIGTVFILSGVYIAEKGVPGFCQK